jgi:hypothetical protein
MTTFRSIASNILLAFVLVTIGFALGKASARRAVSERAVPDPVAVATNVGSTVEGALQVHVYYAHTTVRCSTCNTMEKLGTKVVEGRYAAELADGRVSWKVVDFQQDEGFAKRYEVVSSCIVVVTTRGGKETGHRRLDDVWTHVRNPAVFETYMVGNIDAMLGTARGRE